MATRARSYALEAQDGAGDDGSTLYTLYDERDEIVVSAHWPHPLRAIAAQRGFEIVDRLPVTGGEQIDCERLKGRPMEAATNGGSTPLDEVLAARVSESTAPEPEPQAIPAEPRRKCRAEGCDELAPRRGPYAGYCPAHRAGSAFARRNEPKRPEKLQPLAFDEVLQLLVEARERANQLELELAGTKATVRKLVDQLGELQAA